MAKIVKSCLNLSKLRPKYYRSLIFWTRVQWVVHGSLVIMGRVNLIIGQLGQGHC